MERPEKATVLLYGVAYEVDLVRCRVAMLHRLEELSAQGGAGTGMEMIADAAGVDAGTVARFLKGLRVLPESFVAIVTRGFGLTVSEVAHPAEGEVEALLERRA